MNKLHAALIAALASLGLAFATPALAQKADAPKDAKTETKKADAPKDTKKAEAKADAKKADAKKADAKKDAAPKGELMDINSASEKELASLKGIGEVRAKAIVKGRPYKGKNELVDKKIIPQNVYDDIKDQIIAKQDTAAAKKDAPKKDAAAPKKEEKKDEKKK